MRTDFNFQKIIAPVAIVILIFLSIQDNYHTHSKVNEEAAIPCAVILFVGYTALIVHKLRTRRSKEAKRYLWGIRLSIIALLLIPYLYRIEDDYATMLISAGFFKWKSLAPLMLLWVIEELIDFWLWVMKRR